MHTTQLSIDTHIHTHAHAYAHTYIHTHLHIDKAFGERRSDMGKHGIMH